MNGTKGKFVKILSKGTAALLLTAVVGVAQYFPVDSIKGPGCVVRDSVTGKSLPLSPETTKFNTIITDGFAHVRVVQMYVNRIPNVNDIVYVFPLPHEGSVHGMAMEYQNKLYRAEILEKEQAQHIYDSVTSEGGQAALLIQQKPNIFQQRLANIAYGDTAYVEIKLSMPLSYNNGEYELALPTRIAPRFGGESGMPVDGNPWNPPADIDGPRLQINTIIQTSFPISYLQSPTHPLNISEIATARPELEKRNLMDSSSIPGCPHVRSALLQSADTYPNKDFVLRFSRNQAELDFHIASTYDPDRNEGYFALQLFPGNDNFTEDRGDIELIVLVDISGSQDGWPLAKEKAIARELISRLTPSDRLCLASFSNSVHYAFGTQTGVSATAENLSTADGFIGGLQAGGGTRLYDAVKSILAVPLETEHQRYFVFLTDGQIGNEEAILSEIADHPTNPTIFTFGAGNNLNRYFIDRAAQVGNGHSAIVTQHEGIMPYVNDAWSKIESPAIKNVSVEFGGLDTAGVVLPVSSNLYVGSPLYCYGKYETGGEHTVTIRGYQNGEQVTISNTIPFESGPNMNAMLPKIWARQTIGRLEVEEGAGESNKQRIVDISTEYQVLSNYTAFLAVNPEVVSAEESLGDEFVYTSVAEQMPGDRLTAPRVNVTIGRLTIEVPEYEELREIRVYDVRGRLVFKLDVRGKLRGGVFRWDGILPDGTKLRTGRYIMRIVTSKSIVTRRLLWRAR